MSPHQESTSTPSGMDRALDQGAAHLRRREWREARGLFEQVLADDPGSPEAWEGLATAALVPRRCGEEPVRRTNARIAGIWSATTSAARRASRFSWRVYHDAYRGESAIASGWFERARSLLDTVPAAAEHAWLAFWKAHIDIHIHGEVAKGEPSLEDAIRLNEAGKSAATWPDDARPSRADGDQRRRRRRRAAPPRRSDDRSAGR